MESSLSQDYICKEGRGENEVESRAELQIGDSRAVYATVNGPPERQQWKSTTAAKEMFLSFPLDSYIYFYIYMAGNMAGDKTQIRHLLVSLSAISKQMCLLRNTFIQTSLISVIACLEFTGEMLLKCTSQVNVNLGLHRSH